MTRVLALMLVFLVAAIGGAGAAGLRAGAAAVDITPRVYPINMPGGFSENPADGAADPLNARALVFDDGTMKLAIVIVDNLGVPAEVAVEAKAAAAKECGIPAEKIMIASTHTHSGPPATDKTYRQILVDGIAQAIVQAHGALRLAAVGVGVRPLPDEVFNRRWFLKPGTMPLNPFGKMDQVKMNPGRSPDVLDRPAGPTDPDITVLSVQDARRKPLALLASYSLHYVGGGPRGKISADYYGEVARLLPSRVGAGEGFVPIMANGTSGNINNIPFGTMRPPRAVGEQVRIVAGKAADTAWLAWKDIKAHDGKARLGMAQREITLKVRHPDAEQLAYARKVLAVKDEAEKNRLPRLADAYARRVLALADAPATLTVPIQALRIGDLAICAIPFETFVETGLELKKRSPFPRTIVMGISNGFNGYLPTPEQHKLGGYETWLGTNKVQEDTSVILVKNLTEMMGELAKEK